MTTKIQNKSESPGTGEAGLRPVVSRELLQVLKLQQLTNHLANAKAREQKQIENLRSFMPPQVLRCFDNLTEHGRPAAAMVTPSGSCGSCHLKLPSGIASRLYTVDAQISHCPNCGCFLYSAAALPVLAPKPGRVRAQEGIRAL